MSASAAKVVVAPVVSAKPVKAALYAASSVITLTPKGASNPKRGAAALRYNLYLAAAAAGTPLTIAAYLAACVPLNPSEPAYRWRADISWDLKRGFITLA